MRTKFGRAVSRGRKEIQEEEQELETEVGEQKK